MTRSGRPPADAGSAIIEFVFVALVVLMPLMYLIVAVAVAQRSELAVAQAARDAGRAFATSDDAAQAPARMRAAVRLALAAQALPDDATVRVVAAGAPCASAETETETTPALTPGASFRICVSRQVILPAVPALLAGKGITTVGEYVVHVDDYRSTR